VPIELDDNLSDLDLYEKARLEKEGYEIVLQLKPANKILTID
jgi:hypothetical protein